MNSGNGKGIDDRIRELVEFDRFYAARLRAESRAEGEVLAGADVTPLQVEVFHLVRSGPCSPVWLSWRLQVDPGYVSRTLRFMEEMRFVKMSCAPGDRRRRQVELTALGRACAESLEKSCGDRARTWLVGLQPGEQEELVSAMGTVARLVRRAAGIMSG
jgi:DNA-binding MarR family transcriptional regulator